MAKSGEGSGQVLARATRGRGIIISSGAKEPFAQRGPADVANMATFFGLNQKQAKVRSMLAQMQGDG